MNLTAEQVAAAEAAGCRFLPVPPDALNRFAMQRKLFRLPAGVEVLATRGGGLYETVSTLGKLIEEGRALLPPAQEPVVEVAPSAPEPVASEPPAVDDAVEPAPAPAEAPRRKPRARRAPAALADTAPPPAAIPLSTPTAITPRARKSAEMPRWATAGAERRGRADQHWSRRGR